MDEKNLDLMPRNENIRDKFHTEVIKFELDEIMKHFTETIEAINAQFDICCRWSFLSKRSDRKDKK